MTKLNRLINHLQALVSSAMFRVFVFGLFIIQTSVLAIVTGFGVPPDEGNQIEFIKYYAHHSMSPFLGHQTPTLNLGDVTREIDYVYHYVMSLVMRISPLPDHIDLYVIRFFSIGFAVLTFVLLLRLLHELRVGRAASNIGLLILTNIPMVLMMSSVVNADVLVWLGTVAGIYFMLRVWRRHEPLDLLTLLTIAVYGGLIKRTLFPICFVFGIAAIVALVKYRHDIVAKVNLRNWKQIVIAGLLLIGVGLFVERAGVNVYQYHTLTPSCAQVQGDAACTVFWLHERTTSLEENEESAVAIWLGEGSSIDQSLSSFPVFVVKWSISSFNNIVDIQTQGWRHEIVPPFWEGSVILILMTVTTIYGIIYELRRFKRDENARWRLVMIGFALLVVLSQLIVNYSTYRHSHIYGLALNGRYILPAVVLLSCLSIWYGHKILGKIVGFVIIMFVIIMVIGCSGLIMMLRNPQLFHG